MDTIDWEQHSSKECAKEIVRLTAILKAVEMDYCPICGMGVTTDKVARLTLKLGDISRLIAGCGGLVHPQNFVDQINEIIERDDPPVPSKLSCVAFNCCPESDCQKCSKTGKCPVCGWIRGQKFFPKSDIIIYQIREKFRECYGKLDDFANRSSKEDDPFTAFIYTILKELTNEQGGR